MENLKKIVYAGLNVLNGGRGFKVKINDFQLRLPTRYFRYFPADYEAQNFQFLRKTLKKGDTVIDIGAHFGLFSVRAAQLTGPTGKVYAFEPTPSTFNIMQKTIAINGQEQVIIPVKAALADRNGEATFYYSDSIGDVANSLVNYNDQFHKGYPVKLITCDSFVQDKNIRVNFLKIDAEGAELSVLKGAEMVLKQHKPHGILAMHPASIKMFGDSNEAIWDFLQTLNYQYIFNGKPIDKKTFCEKKELFDVHFSPL